MVSMKDRVAVVTGGMGGIGGAVALRCLQQGATVICCGSRPPETALAGVAYETVDIRDTTQVDSFASSVFAHSQGRVALINCAGVVDEDTPAENLADSAWARVINTNLTGTFKACRAFGRHMISRGGGDIVNITSMSGNHVVNIPQRQVAYNVSKAAVGALTRTLAAEWGGRGVRVNSIAPGYIDTPMTASRSELHEEWTAATIIGRMGSPSEVAAAVVFLLSDEASYFVGAELLMDGGYSLT